VLVLNFIVGMWVVFLLGGDTEFAGFGFTMMISVFVSLIIFTIQLVRCVIKVFAC
jgi:hypothetical protein